MRKYIKYTVIILLIILAIGLVGRAESTYTRTVTVVNTQDNEVIVKDYQGNYWSFVGEGYKVNEQLTVVMTDNHTSTITDDEIIRVKS